MSQRHHLRASRLHLACEKSVIANWHVKKIMQIIKKPYYLEKTKVTSLMMS